MFSLSSRSGERFKSVCIAPSALSLAVFHWFVGSFSVKINLIASVG